MAVDSIPLIRASLNATELSRTSLPTLTLNLLASCIPCLLPPIEPFDGRLAGAGLHLASFKRYTPYAAPMALAISVVRSLLNIPRMSYCRKMPGLTSVIILYPFYVILAKVFAVLNLYYLQ